MRAEVRYARLSKCYRKYPMTLEVAVIHATPLHAAWGLVKKTLTAKGADEKQGAAPMGDMEHHVQDILHTLREQAGGALPGEGTRPPQQGNSALRASEV